MKNKANKKQIVYAIIGASLLIAVALLMNVLTANNYIDRELSRRVMGVIFGVILVLSGNWLPKALPDERCKSARGQSLRRFAGWTFVIAGLVYSSVWLVAPVALARILSMSVCAVAVLLVATPFTWLVLTRKRAQPPTEM